jgi:hypothetical protein
MLKYIFAILFFIPSFASAQDFLDLELSFGSYDLELKYIYQGTKAPYEGYLLQPHDIAMLKVDLDSYKKDCEEIVHKASLSCLNDLQRCTDDANERHLILVEENGLLLKELDNFQEKLSTQTQKTYIYSIASGSLVFIATFMYFNLR